MKKIKKMLLYFTGAVILIILTFNLIMRINFGYAIQDDKVVYRYYDNVNFRKAARTLTDADPTTFKSFGMNGLWGKDKNQVYLEGRIIREADPSTFELISNLYSYSRDAHQVFAHWKAISNRPDQFRHLGNGYAIDGQYAFKKGDRIEGADGATFELVDEGGEIAMDAQHVFYYGSLMEDSHSASFQDLNFSFSKDKNHVYRYSSKIEGADAETFEVLSSYYGRDANHVYFESKKMTHVDLHSFALVGDIEKDSYARDNQRKYRYGKEVEEFPASLVAQFQ